MRAPAQCNHLPAAGYHRHRQEGRGGYRCGPRGRGCGSRRGACRCKGRFPPHLRAWHVTSGSQGPRGWSCPAGDSRLCAFHGPRVELERLAEQGLVAIACNPTQAPVAPNGGKQPLLGTNPIAFGWPYPSDAPFIFHFATSTIARGDIELYRREERVIPEAWGVDRHGAPCW